MGPRTLATDADLPTALFAGEPLFADTDGDGLPDRLRLFFAVDPRLSHPALWAEAANFAARLAAEVAALDPPVVHPLGDPPPDRPALILHAPDPAGGIAARLERRGRLRLHLVGHSATAMAEILHRLACRGGGLKPPPGWRTLELAGEREACAFFRDGRGRILRRLRLPRLQPAGRGQSDDFPGNCDLLRPGEAVYRAVADEPRGRRLALAFAICAPRLPAVVGFALCEAAARLALEATVVDLPLAFAGPPPRGGATLELRLDSASGARLTWESSPAGGAGSVLRLTGGPRPVARLLRLWAELAVSCARGEGCLAERLEKMRALLGGRGRQGAWAHALVAAATGGGGLPPVSAEERPRVCKAARALALPPPLPATRRPVLRRKRLPEETEEHLEALRRLPPGSGAVEGTLWVGKPRAARQALRRRAVQLLCDRGYRLGRLCVLHAYKPGLSWLLEEILPRLRRRKGLARLEIAFRPFDAGPDGLEMETRFLQEIYPGPDRLAKALRLPPKAVELLRVEDLAEAYRVRAFDRSGRLLLEEGITPRLSRRPIFPGRPEKGFVHPATGGIRLCRGGALLLERSIATDRERFWDVFQEEFLPALTGEMEARLAAGTEGLRVFWEEVRIEAAIAEEDRRVGVGEERVSPLEALHEDLYFGLLEFHDDFCRDRGLAGNVSFGRIVPRVRRLARGEAPRAALRAIPAPPRPAEAPGPEPAAVRLGLEGGKLEVLFAGAALAGPRAEAFCRLGAAWGLGLRLNKDGRGVLGEVSLPHQPIRGPRPSAPRLPRPRLDRRVALAEIESEVAALGSLPAVRGFRAGTSLQGRPIWALELAGEAGGSLVSHSRRRLLRPTLLFNARHHANEVASTQAALRFAWELAATGPGQRVLSRVNAVVIPLENPDGVALLEALLPDCPGHKLHAARYNAAGVEWYADYFAPEPRFPEALPKAALWRRWLPLFVLDAHGVPGHEWDQPFAGNAPGRFRAYWIPRAFVYAILPFLETPGHPGHRRARAIARLLGRALLADPRIAAREEEFRDRYRRYAHRWAPEVFPAPARRGLTVCATEERLSGLNFAARRFPVTVTEVVTEVADEGVEGRLLEDCARAHLLAAWALIEEIARFAGGRISRERRGGGLRIAWRGGQPGAIARRGGGRSV